MTGDRTSMVDSARRLAELRQDPAELAATEAGEEAEFEPEQDYGAFTLVSADRQRKVAVEFRMLNGDRKSRTYAFLAGIDYNPSTGIVMDFSADKVTITGRNLGSLMDGLVPQRVGVVREMDDLQAEANLPDDAIVITKIEIKSVD